MKPVLVLYATREGHTRRIAEHIGATLRGRHVDAEVLDAGNLPGGFSLDHHAAVILAASVHIGKHEKEMVEFVKAHRDELDRLPAGFVSISLSEAGAENETSPPDRRAQAAADVQRLMDDFFTATNWHPQHVRPVAGALLYSKYNFLLRIVMRFIAKSAGGATDTSQDHVYTDWEALDRFAEEMITSAGNIEPRA